MLNLMEGIVPEYDRKGVIRGPSGSSVTGIVPTNAYPCRSAPSTPEMPAYVVIGANADSMYERLMKRIGREDLTGESYKHNHHRVIHQATIEEAISSWTREHTVEEVLEALHEIGVPGGRIANVRDIVENEHIIARGAIEDVWVGGPAGSEDAASTKGRAGWNVKMPRVVPVLGDMETKTRWAGPELGAHNEEVLCGELGLAREEVDVLIAQGVVGAWQSATA